MLQQLSLSLRYLVSLDTALWYRATSIITLSIPAISPRGGYTEGEEVEVEYYERRHQVTPGSFFKLFFTPEVFAELAENTNNYANMKHAHLPSTARGRRWRKTSAGEIMIFIGLFIYMGAHKAMRTPLYLNKIAEFPTHEISYYMSQYGFEQLKRYFHVSPVNSNASRPARRDWAPKLQPLASQLESHFQRYIIPASNILVDAMMVRFTGRSSHTDMRRAKPIPQGYKMLALCERRYTFSFLFTSPVDKFYHLNILYDGPSRQSLSPTSCAVFQLLSSLPSESHRFILYYDNDFSNISLFIALREYSIAACGTVRPISAVYTVRFKIDKRKKCLAWNTLTAVAIGPILAVLWQDKTLVRFLTTYHTCTPELENFTSRLR